MSSGENLFDLFSDGILTAMVRGAEGTASFEAEVIVRQAFLADCFVEGIAPYIQQGQHQGVTLRAHQSPALAELQTVMSEMRDEPDRRILWPSPPNFGKSTMSALALREAGMGKCPPESNRPLRSLVLVPRDMARNQVISACGEFAPSLRVSGFVPSDGKEAINYADALVMTYKGCVDMAEEDWDYLARRADLWVLDEVHRGLGENISERLRRAMDRYKPTVLALSATPDFSEDRTAAEILRINRTLPSMTPREAIEANVSNGVQLIAIHSGAALHLGSKRSSITEADTMPLIRNPERNKLITDIMLDMGNLGVRGLVSCAPGNENTHARLIAKMASEREITDHMTGEKRLLRVESVGTHNPNSADVLARFKDGELDALTFSKYLLEAYDNGDVRYILSAVPISSEVEMGQLVGRGARLGDPRITRIFTILDTYSSTGRKAVCTPFHIFGEQDFHQGMKITSPREPSPTLEYLDKDSPSHTKGYASRTEGGEDNLFSGLSKELREIIGRIPQGTILDEFLISRTALREAPPGYMPLIDLPAVREGKVSAEGARYALRGQIGADGQPASVLVVTDAPRTYVSPDAAVLLEERYNFGSVVTRNEITNFLQEQGWPRISLDGFAACCERAGVTFDVRKRNVCLTPNDAHRLLVSMSEISLVDPSAELLLTDLLEPLAATNSRELLTVLRKSMTVYEPHMLTRRRGRQPGAYQPVNALTTEGAILLIKDVVKRAKTRKPSQDPPPEIVARLQHEHRQYAWNEKLVPTLTIAAIEDFMESVKYGPTAPKVDPPYDATAPPSPLLNESLRLSGYENAWRRYAACIETDPDLFSFTKGAEVNAALSICAGCTVVADCMLFDMKQTEMISGTLGGLKQSDRKQLFPIRKKVVEWLENRQPVSEE